MSNIHSSPTIQEDGPGWLALDSAVEEQPQWAELLNTEAEAAVAEGHDQADDGSVGPTALSHEDLVTVNSGHLTSDHRGEHQETPTTPEDQRYADHLTTLLGAVTVARREIMGAQASGASSVSRPQAAGKQLTYDQNQQTTPQDLELAA